MCVWCLRWKSLIQDFQIALGLDEGLELCVYGARDGKV